MRYAPAIISALLLGGATATLALQPGAAQTAQNDPSQMAQVALWLESVVNPISDRSS